MEISVGVPCRGPCAGETACSYPQIVSQSADIKCFGCIRTIKRDEFVWVWRLDLCKGIGLRSNPETVSRLVLNRRDGFEILKIKNPVSFLVKNLDIMLVFSQNDEILESPKLAYQKLWRLQKHAPGSGVRDGI